MVNIALMIILLAGGLALVVAEIITLSFGLLSVMSVACLAAAVYFAFAVSPTLGASVIVALVIGLPIYISLMIKLIRRTPLGRKLMIRDAVAHAPPAEVASLVGREGKALTPLRPSGTIAIGEQRLVASAESGFIPAGAAVRVIKAGEINVVVRQVTPLETGPQ